MKKYDLKTFDVVCPMCNLHITGYSRALGLHAKQHNISSDEFYVMLFCNGVRPKCLCKDECQNHTRWLGWNVGFESCVKGHFSDERIQKMAKSRSLTVQHPDWKHWSTRDNAKEIIKKSAEKRSLTMKKKISSGEHIMWMSSDKSKEIREKILQTRKKNYSAKDNPLRMTYNTFIERLNLVIQDKFEIIDGLQNFNDRNTNFEHKIIVKCKTCSYEHKSSAYNLIRRGNNQLRCKNCGYDSTPSKSQLEILEYVKSLEVDVLLNNRTLIAPLEIDVLIPGQLAIEFDGLYWHSELFASKFDKEIKRKKCLEQNIQYLSFFEDEWEHKTNICKSMISYRLKKNLNKVGARNCNIVTLDKVERKKFFSNSHLDGDVKSIISFGLMYDDEIVAAISLRKPLGNHGNAIEVARFATKPFVSVAGGLARLIAVTKEWAKLNNYEKIITYVDARVGSGTSYVLAGFRHLDDTTIRFWWTDKTQRFSRQKIKAQNGISEREISLIAGMYKIYGCVNHKFIIDLL